MKSIIPVPQLVERVVLEEGTKRWCRHRKMAMVGSKLLDHEPIGPGIGITMATFLTDWRCRCGYHVRDVTRESL